MILIDEVTMATNYVLDAINQCCQVIMCNNEFFGGKVVLLGGDFRQCLPVVRKGCKTKILESTVKSSKLWKHFKHVKLSKNMRAINDFSYSEWLLNMGNGILPGVVGMAPILPGAVGMAPGTIEIPKSMLLKKGDNIIDTVFGDNSH